MSDEVKRMRDFECMPFGSRVGVDASGAFEPMETCSLGRVG